MGQWMSRIPGGERAVAAATRLTSRTPNALPKFPVASGAPPAEWGDEARWGGRDRFQASSPPLRPPPPPRGETQVSSTPSPQPTAVPDMSPELLKFLQDAGPLKKQQRVDRSTPAASQKPVVVSTAAATTIEEEVEKQQQPETPSSSSSSSPSSLPASTTRSDRKLESMPLAEQVPGFETVRNTAFSTRPDLQDPQDFGLNVLDLYRLLSSSSTTTTTTTADPMESFYQAHLEKLRQRAQSIAAESSSRTTTSMSPPLPPPVWTAAQQERHRQWLQQTVQALALPVVLLDTDGSYVGVTPQQAADLPLYPPATQVRLVLEEMGARSPTSSANEPAAVRPVPK